MGGRNISWRPLVAVAGLLTFVGGAMHPDASAANLPLRANFASMMANGSWVPGHLIMTVGGAFLLGGVVLARRDWPLSDALLRLALVAAVLNLVELVIHTAVVVDEAALRAGETHVLTALHLAGSGISYPLFGITVAILAWRLAGAWSRPLWVVSAVGIIGGICNALSTTLALLTGDSNYGFLFPVAGISISVWLFVLGVAGLRFDRSAKTAVAPSPA